MDSKEIAGVVESVSNEKGLAKDKVFEVLENALAFATKSCLNKGDINIRVSIDRKSCEYKAYRQWEVVADEESGKPTFRSLVMITLSAAQYDNPTLQIGDIIEEEISLEDATSRRAGFDRIAATAAKNIISQKLRDAEKERVIESYKHLIGKIVTGTVKKKAPDYAVLDLGARQTGNNAEAVIRREDWLKSDKFMLGQRVSAVLLPIDDTKNSSQLRLSRASDEFLKELIAREVPEVADGFVEIRSVARVPGVRSKIAVLSKDRRIDPVGACIGMRQTRLAAIHEELSGEKLEIIIWNADPLEFVKNAMAPAQVVKGYMDDTAGIIDLAVTEENKALAIGKDGINVRLASKLTGWKLNVLTVADYEEKLTSSSEKIVSMFVEKLNIDQDFAEFLVGNGFENLDSIAYVDREELTSLHESLTDEIAEALQSAALAAIDSGAEKAAELLGMEGIDRSTAAALADKGVYTKEDLAELATDDLLDIDDMTREKANALIMQARTDCHWFD